LQNKISSSTFEIEIQLMRKIKIAVIVLLSGSFFSAFNVAQAQEKKSEKIEWMTIQDATAKAQAHPKKFFIDVYTSWCGWCKKMDATTFEDPAIVAYMKKKLLCC
jgi:thiol:disulfide interchange protein